MPGEKVCVILGAGASYDVRNLGTPDEFPAMRPPLAKGLFNMEDNTIYFDNLMAPYPRAKVLTQIIAPRAAAGTETIETELARLARHDDWQTRQDFKQIPPYLRDLLHKVSRDHTQLPGNYVQLAHLLLKDHECEVLFIVLNYDDLLEQALTWLYPEFQFTEVTHYVDEKRPFKVVKLHGSINWFTTLSEEVNADWFELITGHDIFKRVPENDIVIHDSLSQSLRWMGGRNRYVYPLVTAPVAGDAKAPVCPDSHIETARQFLSDCDKFLVIGTTATDQDLLELLDSSLQPTAKPLLHVVDKSLIGEKSNAAETAQRLGVGVNVFYRGNLVEPETLFDGGFAAYVNSVEINTFANYKL